MTDNKKKKGTQDRTRINFNEPYELAYWAKKWKVSERQLCEAHRVSGSVMVEQIEAFLKDQGMLL